MRTRTRNPALARSHSASANCRAGQPAPVHQVMRSTVCSAFRDRFKHRGEDLAAFPEDRDRVAFSEVDSRHSRTTQHADVLTRLRRRAVVQQGRRAPPGSQDFPTNQVRHPRTQGARATAHNDRTADPGATRRAAFAASPWSARLQHAHRVAPASARQATNSLSGRDL